MEKKMWVEFTLPNEIKVLVNMALIRHCQEMKDGSTLLWYNSDKEQRDSIRVLEKYAAVKKTLQS